MPCTHLYEAAVDVKTDRREELEIDSDDYYFGARHESRV
jgi:hypothetical protein